jgi:putative membrane protein
MMWGHGPHDMGWGGWVMMGLMLIFWFGLIALIITAITGTTFGRRPPVDEPRQRGDMALTILRERFARGDITAEEYERARTTLTEDERTRGN